MRLLANRCIEAGMSLAPTDTQGRFVGRVNIFEGRVDVTFGNEAHAEIFGDTISFTPYMSGSGSIQWRCGAAPEPANANPMTGNGVTSAHQAPQIPSRYLPSACRE